MRTMITLVSAVALMVAPTVASAAFAPAPAERANAELKDSNALGGKEWLFGLAIVSMGILAVLVSKPHSPQSP